MRNIYIDSIRGLLMLYIVAIIHGIYWLSLIRDPSRSLLLFEMPAIFLLSGYSYALFAKNTNFLMTPLNYIKFGLSRISRILIPYIPVAIASAVLYIYINDITSELYKEVFFAWLNPFEHGGQYRYHMTTWHLWFIKPFLIVTLTLPLIVMKSKYSFILKIMVLYCIYLLSGTVDNMSTPIFYLIWAWIGYQMGNGFELSRKSLYIVLFIALLILVISKIYFSISIDMQHNKFPPNLIFFLFSVVWIVFFLLLFSYINTSKVEFLSKSKWLKPFILYGYSIYLWQGIGYSIAKMISEKIYDINTHQIWVAAIIISVFLGSVVFGFLENIRFRIKKK